MCSIICFVKLNRRLKLFYANTRARVYSFRAQIHAFLTGKIVVGDFEAPSREFVLVYIPLKKGKDHRYCTRTVSGRPKVNATTEETHAAARAILSLRGNDNTPPHMLLYQDTSVSLSWNISATAEEYLNNKGDQRTSGYSKSGASYGCRDIYPFDNYFCD